MAWSAITDAEIDPESPGTTGLFGKYRDNQEELYDSQIVVIKSVLENDAVGALQNDDELLFPVAVNEIWMFEMVIRVTTSAAAADLTWDFTVPGATTYMVVPHVFDPSAIAILDHYAFVHTAGAAASTFRAQVTDAPVLFKGWFDAAAAGNVQFRWARVGGGTNTSILAGSYLHAKRVYTTM